MASQPGLADVAPPVCGLKVGGHFEGLSEREKLYAHHLSRAAFAGTRIILRQNSPESEGIFDLIMSLYKLCGGNFEAISEQLGLPKEDLERFLDYAAMFLDNLGNYRSFGDSKFVPRMSPAAFSKLVSTDTKTEELYTKLVDQIYSPAPTSIGYPCDGHQSNYYPESPDITKEEISGVQRFLESKSISSQNTRLKKLQATGEPGKPSYELLVASALTSGDAQDSVMRTEYQISGCGDVVDGCELHIRLGDHSMEMATTVTELRQARNYTANENQNKMLDAYIESFQTGSIQAHRESQKWWIKDVSPSVESNLGFIECYRDPHGIRCEWEGFVAIVNKKESRKFAELVSRSAEFIVKLPWNGLEGGCSAGERSAFEAPKFMVPDFTSLEILSYATSQIWAGIIAPNYGDIRETLGFKNVSLGNRIAAQAPTEALPFIPPDEVAEYRRRRTLAFEIAVAIHELLGHGSGLLLAETSRGVHNFDTTNPPISPVDGKQISTWYHFEQTPDSVFGSLAQAYEECRAECVGLFLAGEVEILRMFGCTDEPGDYGCDEILYTIYLQMVFRGVDSLQTYNPVSKKWGQAHERARFAIMITLLNAGDNFLILKHSKDTLDDITIQLDKSKMLSHGKPAVGKLLQKLHIYRASADLERGTKLLEDLTVVDNFFLKVREVVLRKKQPRKLFVQPNTVLGEDGIVSFKDYPLTNLGIIQSWAERGV